MATILHDADDLRPNLGPTPRHHRIECATALEAIRRWVRLAADGHDVYLGDHPPADLARAIYVTVVTHYPPSDCVLLGYGNPPSSNFSRMDAHYRFLPRSHRWERRTDAGAWVASEVPDAIGRGG